MTKDNVEQFEADFKKKLLAAKLASDGPQPGAGCGFSPLRLPAGHPGAMNAPAHSVAAESRRSAEPFLRLSGLRKTYPGVVALADFSMDVRPGEVIGLVGENGAGKSTLMKILGGVIEPDRGTIEIDGVAAPVAHRRRSRWRPASPSSTRNSTSSTT